MTNLLVQEVFFDDLSHPYYQIKYGAVEKSFETKFCQWAGSIAIFTSFLSQFYCLFLAVLIKQVLKDPIHRLNRYIYFYHFLTIFISLALTGIISLVNNFGVEVRCSKVEMPIGNLAMWSHDDLRPR